MTKLNASLETVLRSIELTAHERALMENCATLRRLKPGEELHQNTALDGETSLLILVRGNLSIARKPLADDMARARAETGFQIVAADEPVLVPPPRSSLLMRSETEIEIIEFGDVDCAFLMGTCRAFRALVFAAANAGVAQITDGQKQSTQDPQRCTDPSLSLRVLH